jgi:uncharacterized 2Fe-2S/4Fe-4S cluster protein (DUF4445 family)
MPALPGAISGVTLLDDRLSVATIAGAPPTGICGTGVLSAIATLLVAGVIDSNGRLVAPSELDSNLASRLVEREGETAFVLHRDARHELLLTQGDIRQVQLAKAAVRAGIEILFLRAGGVPAGTALTVTGSFGSAIAADLLRDLGFIPQGVGKIECVSDGALAGVERFFSGGRSLEGVDALFRRITVVPLSGSPEFEVRFLNAMDFWNGS